MIVLSGCGTKKEESKNKDESNKKIVSCTLYKKDVSNGYELSSTYKIFAEESIVNGVETTEIISSDNIDTLSYFETTLKNTYDKMNIAYGGYDVSITNQDGKVTSIIKIDYTVLNVEQLLIDNPSMKVAANNNNQLTLDGIISMYEIAGATCKK